MHLEVFSITQPESGSPPPRPTLENAHPISLTGLDAINNALTNNCATRGLEFKTVGLFRCKVVVVCGYFCTRWWESVTT